MKVTKIKHFLTADLHLFHQRIIKYADRTKYEDSEKGAMDMTHDIVNFINKSLPDELGVVLWILGDVFYGPLLNKYSFEDLQELVTTMRGKHRCLNLVIGNHDRDFRALGWKKANNANWIDQMSDEHIFRNFGFTCVYGYPIIFGNLIFSHEPVFLSKDSKFLNIHGHTHNTFVDENYFTWKCENHDMVKKAFESVGRELPKDIDDKKENWEELIVDPHKYINACWDVMAPSFHMMELDINSDYVDIINLKSEEDGK